MASISEEAVKEGGHSKRHLLRDPSELLLEVRLTITQRQAEVQESCCAVFQGRHVKLKFKDS